MTAVAVVETSPRRSPVLGVAAFAVALFIHVAGVAILVLPLEGLYNLLSWLPVLGLVGLALGLLAIYLRRGLLWGIAAISIAIAGNSYVHSVFVDLFGLLFRAMFGAPEFLR